MLKIIYSFLSGLLGRKQKTDLASWEPAWSEFLEDNVHFYAGLNDEEKTIFHKRVLLFLSTTNIESGYFDVSDEDRLLVAASAIIPV